MRFHYGLSKKQRTVFILFITVSLLLVCVVAYYSFHMDSQRRLTNSAMAKVLEFKSDMNGEAVQALEMSYSREVIDYLSHVDDPVKREKGLEDFRRWQERFRSHSIFWISNSDLKYYSNGEYKYTMNKTDPQYYWYERVFASESFRFSVSYDSALDETCLWVNIPVFDHLGNRVGVTGTGLPMDMFIESLYKNLESGSKMFLYNGRGSFFSSTNIENNAMTNGTDEKTLHEFLSVSKNIQNLFPGSLTTVSVWHGEYVIAPISGISWYLLFYEPLTFKLFFENALMPLVAVLIIAIISLIVLQNRSYQSENAVIRAQKQEIEQLNASQNSFFSSMSHEIRTPINTIVGLNEMILREQISDEVAENARTIQNAGKLLLALISDILDKAKMDSGELELVDAPYRTADMLNQVVSMMDVRAREKSLEFKVLVDPSCPSVLSSDQMRIEQILLNIVNNAIKYTPKGSVTLSVHRMSVEGDIATMVYAVRDTGIGIKKESIPYLFDAFKRVDIEKNRMIEGTGLGLAIVKQLVTLLNGTISVDSIYTEGSIFTITLPQKIVDPTPVGELVLTFQQGTVMHGNYVPTFEAPSARVLVVDDNEMNLLVAEKLLRATKIQVDCVSSAKAALQKTISTHYDAILMDHLMPDMDGILCLHEIRLQTGGLNRRTPIIALTANVGSGSQELYTRKGFAGYLEKPVSGLALEGALQAVISPDLLVRTENTTNTLERQLFNTDAQRTPLVISTVSVCDLPKELIETFGIKIIPCHVITESGDFLDNQEIGSDDMVQYLENREHFATSLPPSVKEYEQYFARLLRHAQAVIHLTTIAQDGNDSDYKNALEASRSFSNITIFDSQQVSASLGLLAIRAQTIASQQPVPAVVLKKLEAFRDNINASFFVDETSYLEWTNRIPHWFARLCQVMLLHPIISVKDGKLKVGGVCLGSLEQSEISFIHSTFRKRSTIDDNVLFITYVGMNTDEVEKIRRKVCELVPFKSVYLQKASPVVTLNVGKGTFSLVFLRK